MFNFKKIQVTIEFADIPGIFNYPKHLPIPKKDDEIHFDGMYGIVRVVRHMTNGNITNIRIDCIRMKSIE